MSSYDIHTSNFHLHNTASKLIDEVAKKEQELLLEQLGDLVKSGLLVVERGERLLTMEENSCQVRISQTVRFKLRDQELIKRLRDENDDLRHQLEVIGNAIRGHIK